MAGKNLRLPRELNPNATTRLKKKENVPVSQNSGNVTMKQGTNPQTKQSTKRTEAGQNAIKNAVQKRSGTKTLPTWNTERTRVSENKQNKVQSTMNSYNRMKRLNNADEKKYVERAVLKKVDEKTSPRKAVTNTKATLKKAFNAEQTMKERRANAMANRDKSKNPNNVNTRGIVKKGKGKR